MRVRALSPLLDVKRSWFDHLLQKVNGLNQELTAFQIAQRNDKDIATVSVLEHVHVGMKTISYARKTRVEMTTRIT